MSSQREYPIFSESHLSQMQGLSVLRLRKNQGDQRRRGRPRSITWEARPKPGLASPVNVSKQGLSARLFATNQTPTVVNVRLPKGI